MNKKVLILISITSLVLLSSAIYALSKKDIVYPVKELGNCSSEQNCKIYCDNIQNTETCLSFAEKYNLISNTEILEAKKILKFMLDGKTPGGCKSKKECEVYCDKEENLEECLDFAIKAGLISKKEAEMARKTGGKGPGGCKREECKKYCEDESHFEECIDFAHEHGLIDDKEYEMARKTGGKGPGGCKGKEECEEYCKTHQQECFEFGKKYGLINKEEMMQGKNKEEKCIMKCMIDSGIAPESCKPGPEGEQNSECKKCAEECVKFYEGPCLTEEKWKEKEEECMKKGEHMEAKSIMGDAGNGHECAIDLECIDRSDEWGDNPGKGPDNWEKGHGPGEEFGPPQEINGEPKEQNKLTENSPLEPQLNSSSAVTGKATNKINPSESILKRLINFVKKKIYQS